MVDKFGFAMNVPRDTFTKALRRVSRIYTRPTRMEEVEDKGALLVKSVPGIGKPGILAWNGASTSEYYFNDATVSGDYNAILFYQPGDPHCVDTCGQSLLSLAREINWDDRPELCIRVQDGNISFEDVDGQSMATFFCIPVAKVSDYFTDHFREDSTDYKHLRYIVTFQGLQSRQFANSIRGFKGSYLNNLDYDGSRLTMSTRDGSKNTEILYRCASVDDKFKTMVQTDSLLRAYLPGEQTVVITGSVDKVCSYGRMVFFSDDEEQWDGGVINTIQLQPEYEEINREYPAKESGKKEETVRKPVAEKDNKPEKTSGWSVTIVPALVSVKHIKALCGLHVRAIRDEKGHKVGYVGRGKNKMVLVWRDWYVKRTTEKARTALLKREKVSA